MQEKYLVWIASGYKLAINTLRVIFGLMIFSFSCNSQRVLERLTSRELAEDPNGFFANYFIGHINTPLLFLTCSLASILVVFSTLEIIFLIAVFRRKYWGALGFFIVSLIWLPVEILFISKFLLMPRLINLLINLIILGIFLKVILDRKKYFKR
ncbi:MAG: DUF2127 domain-containing protein [Candidatus Pacearchaeota archaeon]|nr:DUF2127 domain-containing protein [Candidatus Pacearchaeota archaeon]